MANTLGQLTVRLGLDAAEFTSGLTKSEFQAKKFADSFSNKVAVGIVKAQLAIEAFSKAVDLAVKVVPELIEQAGHFQDISEKAGGASSAWASFSVAARIGGTSMDAVAAASVKMSAGLSKIDDDTKGAGQALKAIGLSVQDFQSLDPATQIEAVAKALAEFEDGAGKTAVAVALFGKAGADMLPFLKELGEGVGRVTVLTSEQIKQADEWADGLARNKALLNAYAQSLAVQAIPAISAFTNAITAVIKQFVELEGAANGLKANRVLLDWAEAAALALGTVIETAVAVAKAVRAIAGSFEAVWADVKLSAQNATPAQLVSNAISGDLFKQLDERNKKVAEANQRYVDLWNSDKTAVTRAIRGSFDEQRRLLDPDNARELARFNSRASDMKTPKKRLPVLGLLSNDQATNAAATLRKQLEGQLKAIEDFAQQEQAAYQFANQYLRGVYDDGLTSLADFFDKQQALRDASLQSQLTSYDREIAALEAYKAKALKPQDRLDAENKIAHAVQQRADAQQRASQTNILAAQEEERAFKQLASTYYDFLASVRQLQGDAAGASALRIAKQTQEAQELLTKVGFDPTAAKAQSDAYGKMLEQTDALARAQTDYGRISDQANLKERSATLDSQLSGQSEIETLKRIGAIRQEALGPLAEMVIKAQQLADALGTPEARLFADKLALQFKQAAAEADPLYQKVRDVGRELGDSVGGQIEDALLARGKTLRDRFLGLIEGVADDATRILTHNAITKPLTDWLTNAFGGNGTAAGGGGILGPLFGIGLRTAASGGANTDANSAQEAFRTAEITAENAAGVAAQTAAVTAGTTAMAALTAAADAAATALSTLASTGGGGGAAVPSLLGLIGGGGGGVNLGTATGDDLSLFYGGMATGGVALPGSTHPVNEYGPEMLDVRGRQFLMMGNERGRVIPLRNVGAGGGTVVQVSVTPPVGATRQTAMQWGSEAGRHIQASLRRQGK